MVQNVERCRNQRLVARAAPAEVGPEECQGAAVEGVDRRQRREAAGLDVAPARDRDVGPERPLLRARRRRSPPGRRPPPAGGRRSRRAGRRGRSTARAAPSAAGRRG